MIKDIKGKILKLLGDRGYILQKPSNELLSKGVQFIAKPRRNMNGRIMTVIDYILSAKRPIIESVNNIRVSCLLFFGKQTID